MSEEDFYKQNTQPGFDTKKYEEPPADIPEQIGPYKIDSLLETGGMSTIYLATHPETNQAITVKTLLPKFRNHKDIIEQFKKEAEIIALADHPNVVKLYSYGEWEEGLYIAMEFIEGQSLRRYLQVHPLSLKKALELTLEIAYALCHLHTHGIIHRDLKPENILITESGTVKVIDFGIAQLLKDRDQALAHPKRKFIGTPVYMSPEQQRDPENVSYPSDIYALGIIAYELILGKLSHGKVHLTLMPKGLQKILAQALQPESEQRYQDVVDFITAISGYMNSATLEKDKKNTDQLMELSENLQQAQMALAPLKTPSWEGVEMGLSIHKGSKVSGIYYDFLTLKDGGQSIVLSEHGSQEAEGAVYTAVLRGMVHALAKTGIGHKELIEALHQQLLEDPLKQVFPFALLTLYPEKGHFLYTSCGYGSLWQIGEEEVNTIENHHPALGFEQLEAVTPTEGTWEPEDRLLLTTLPAVKSSDDQPSPELIKKVFEEAQPSSAQSQVEMLSQKVKKHHKEWLKNHSLLFISLA